LEARPSRLCGFSRNHPVRIPLKDEALTCPIPGKPMSPGDVP
jgi:hypothetical protein